MSRLYEEFRSGAWDPVPPAKPTNGKADVSSLDKWVRLGQGEWQGLGYKSQSEAEYAYIGYLAAKYHNNIELIDSDFRSSGLMREKWNRESYRRLTIGKIIDAKVNGKAKVSVGEWILVPFSQIEPEPVTFLWDPYIPSSMLTMLTGDPGVGKSFIALSIAADITRQNGIVFYMTLENHPRKVLRPRFDALGGKPEFIYWVKAIQFGDPSDGLTRTVTLQDVAGLEKRVKEYRPNLIVVDPLQSFLGANIDAYRANETRPVLDGLAEIAERDNVVPLILRHGSKAPTGRTIHRGLGSIDFTGAVRSEVFAGETADKKEKAMAHIKSNIGPLGKTLGYKISSTNGQGTLYKTGFFAWTGESDLKTEDLTRPEETNESLTCLEEAEQFLHDYLGDGRKWQKEVIKKSRAEGIKEITLRRAKFKLKIGSEKDEGMWWWSLPSIYK